MMDCRQVQSVLALAVGQDLPDVGTMAAAREHLAACPNCRRQQRELQVAHAALVESRTQPQFRRGLWPQVAACIADWERRPQFARFNVWVPSLAAAAACLMLVAVAIFEVNPRADRLLPGLAWERGDASRNLFETDPSFAHDHGHVISPEDIARWRKQRARLENVAFPNGQSPQPWPAD